MSNKKCLFDGKITWDFIGGWLINWISVYTGISSLAITVDKMFCLPSEGLPILSDAIRQSFGVAIPTTMYSKWAKIEDIVDYIYDSRELF